MYKILLVFLLILSASLNAFDDESVNNDSDGEYIDLKSSPFQANGNVDGSNSDWHDNYYFKVPVAGSVTITLSSSTDLDFKLGTKYNSQDIVRDTSSNDVKTFTYDAQANKNYYLSLFDNEWRDQSNPYTLKIEFPSDSTSESSDGRVTKIYAHYENATPSSFSANGKTYYWGQGKDLVIDGFEYQGHRYEYVSELPNVVIRRSDNSNASGNPCGLFAEKNTDAYHLKPTFPKDCDMAKIMSGRVINVGALDLFRNTDYTAKNIERVDFISPNGITAPQNSADLSKAGHVVTEKSGNNEIKIAAILSIDSNGNPTKFGPLVSIHGNGSKDYGLATIYLPDGSTIYKQSLGFYANEKNPQQGNPWYLTYSYEPLGMCFVSLQDLGVSAGQKYYGFSYFGRDVTNSMNLVNYNSFPKNTGGDTADPYGGVASYFEDTSLQKEEICYAISDVKNKLYKVYIAPGENPLPVATKIDIVGINDSIDSEGGAYYSVTGLVYAFHEASQGPKMYSIDPSNGEAKYIKTFTNLKSNVVGASFYGGYFYVIAKNGDGDAVLYKINPKTWNVLSSKDLNGETSDADALAINENGEAYIALDGKRKLYSIDIETAKTKYVMNISMKSEPESLSFAKDGKLYTADSEDGVSYDTDKIYQIDISSGKMIAAAQIPSSDDIDIESLSCNVQSIPTPNPQDNNDNAMLLTRGDNNNNDKTNVYAFHIDTETDEITNFHLLKKLNIKFRALTYHNGKFYTSDMSGEIYTIDISTGDYKKDSTYGKIDHKAVSGMDFDENDNIIYSIWDSSLDEQRKLRKYNPKTGSSTILATVPESDDYIDYAVAYFGNSKTVVSVGSGAVRFINGSTIGTHISSSQWCVYGGEYVKDDKGYFVNAESNDLSIYKLDGTNWKKIYTYGSKTSSNKGVAIAIIHDVDNTPLPTPTVSDVKKYEGDSGKILYKVTVNLDKPAPSDLTLVYSTEDGTAKKSDNDYQALSGRRTISKGTKSFTINVYAYGDKKVENDEYFYLNIKLTN